MLFNDRLYLTAGSISYCTLRYWCGPKMALPLAIFKITRHSCLTVVTSYFFFTISMCLSYKSGSVAFLFPTYSNKCSDSYLVRLLTLIFDSAVWSTYTNVLRMVLNGVTAKIAVIFIAYKPIMVSVLISYFTTLHSTLTKCLLQYHV